MLFSRCLQDILFALLLGIYATKTIFMNMLIDTVVLVQVISDTKLYVLLPEIGK